MAREQIAPRFHETFGQRGAIRLTLRAVTELAIPRLRDYHEELLLEYMRRFRVPKLREDHAGNQAWIYSHNLGVERDALALLDALEYEGDLRKTIAVSARFHDVGKTEIPDDILYHPDLRNFPEKWARMKAHPVIGAHIFRQFLPSYKEGPQNIRHHHEPDYPDRINGNKIPLGSRIIAVADKGRACQEPRPWQGNARKPLTINEAIDYMSDQKEKGKVDALIADVWIELARRGKPLGN